MLKFHHNGAFAFWKFVGLCIETHRFKRGPNLDCIFGKDALLFSGIILSTGGSLSCHRHHGLSCSWDGEVLEKNYTGRLRPRSEHLPICIPFSRENITLCMPLIGNWYPFYKRTEGIRTAYLLFFTWISLEMLD